MILRKDTTFLILQDMFQQFYCHIQLKLTQSMVSCKIKNVVSFLKIITSLLLSRPFGNYDFVVMIG